VSGISALKVQLIIGAILASGVAPLFDGQLHPCCCPAWYLAGALAALAGRASLPVDAHAYNANEIFLVSPSLLSSIALQILYYLVTGPLRESGGLLTFLSRLPFRGQRDVPYSHRKTHGVNASLIHLHWLVFGVACGLSCQRS